MKLRRACAVAALTAACLTAAVRPAAAHALLKSSTPAAGETLAAAPAEVRLTFTEPPDPALSVVHVLDSSGKAAETGKAIPDGKLGLAVPVGSLAQGAYTVTWRVVSRADGHLTAGSFSFGVGVPAPPQQPAAKQVATTQRPTPAAVAGRWLLTWGLALLFGAAVSSLLVFRRTFRFWFWALPGVWVLAWVGFGMGVLAERTASGVGLGRLLSSGRGELLVREGVALVVAGVVAVIASLRRNRGWAVALGAATAAALLFHALAGHAGAATSARPFKLGVQWVHLLGVGAWIGGLVWLLAGTRSIDEADRPVAIRRFSRVAAVSLAAVAATGVLRALDQVGTWSALVDTSFGQAVLVKASLFLPLLGLGAINHYRNVPKADQPRRVVSLRRAVSVEIAIAAVILGVTGVLTQLAPSRSLADVAKGTPVTERLVVDGADFATTVRVRLTATPGTVGQNTFELRIVDYDTRKPVEADSVSLRFTIPDRPEIGASTIELKTSAPGVWTTTSTALAIQAPYRVVVTIASATKTLEIPLTVAPREPARQLIVTPGNPVLYTLTIPGVGSLQEYADPGTPGVNQLHATFFDGKGGELPIEQATMTVTKGGAPAAVTVRRLGPGHFVAEADLVAGTYRVSVKATTKDGRTIDQYIDIEIK